MRRSAASISASRQCKGILVGRSGNACSSGVGLCAAALLWWLSGSVLGADPVESAGLAADAELPASSVVESVDPELPDAPLWPWSGDLGTRSQLSGSWAGTREALATNGVSFYCDLTQYYQGVTSGGLARQFEYGGRGDYLLDFDTQKLWGWPGGHIDLRGETRLGQDCNGIDGAISPSNFAMVLPRPGQNVTALTGVQFTQEISEQLSVFAGKLNLLDGTPTAYRRGMRLNYFWNAGMQNNLTRVFLMPSSLGAGVTVRDDVEPVFSFYLLDSYYTPTTSGFQTLFANGVVNYGEYRLRTNWFGLPGHSAFGVLYSNATRTALDTNPYVLLPGFVTGAALPKKNSAWTVTYRLDQVVWADPQDPERGWTLYSDVGLTDGNPNPIRWFANLALVGTSPIGGRNQDTVGLGYYHLGITGLPTFQALGLGAENGVELYYNAAVTPWFHLTPDLQILDPSKQSTATAVLIGIRGRISF
ncbi:MAG: carbohydrate porin [Planctomycetes bacterium]|nr:carbohydrate porin [Planctomycetota bacterium]